MSPYSIMGVLVFVSLTMMFCVTLYLHKRFSGSFGILIAGALGFFVSQVMLRLPMIGVFSQFSDSPLTYILMLAGSAALVETLARYVVTRYALKDRLSWSSGIITGIGHGFCEMLFVFVLGYSANLFLYLIGGSELALLERTLALTPNVYFGLAFLERLFAICFHVAMSLMMVIGFIKQKQMFYTISVFLLHMSFDGAVAYLQLQGMNIYYVEVFIALCALLSMIYVIQMYRNMKDNIELPKDSGEQALDEGY